MGWVFGLSVFSLKGEHVGWFEDGVLYDIENRVLGFVPGAPGMQLEMPALAPEPAMPAFSKRPYVPGLRGRCLRPRGGGWSSQSLASVFAQHRVPVVAGGFLPRMPSQLPSSSVHRG